MNEMSVYMYYSVFLVLLRQCPDVCVQNLKSEGHGSFFGFYVSEMSEMISLKMGVKCAASLSYSQYKSIPNEQQVRDL